MGKCWKSPKKYHRVHLQERPYKCEGCVKAFTYHSGPIKLKWIHHRETSNPSEECDKGFTNNSTLCNFHNIYTGEKHYRCEQIVKAFKSSSVNTKVLELKRDLTTVKYIMKVSFIIQPYAKRQRIHTWENLYKCAEYSQVFSCNLSLHKHERVLQKCKDYDKAFSWFSYFNYPQRLQTGENLHIKIMCHSVTHFNNISNLSQHQRIS